MTPAQKKEFAALAQMVAKLGDAFNGAAADIITLHDRVSLLERPHVPRKPRPWWKFWRRRG